MYSIYLYILCMYAYKVVNICATYHVQLHMKNRNSGVGGVGRIPSAWKFGSHPNWESCKKHRLDVQAGYRHAKLPLKRFLRLLGTSINA